MINEDLKDVTPLEGKYPIGSLNGIKIHFLHYRNFEEAKLAWNRRMTRINRDNMYVVLIERDGCSEQDLLRFDNLSFKNKVAIVHCTYENIACAHKISGYEKMDEVGQIANWDGWGGKRLYDKFDWVNFLNS